MTLLERMRKARRSRVEAGGLTFVVRCPSDLEAARLGRAGVEDLLAFVADWEGVQEIHLVPGGSAIEVPFDAAVCREFLAYRPDLWDPIAEAVMAAYTKHVSELDDALKN